MSPTNSGSSRLFGQIHRLPENLLVEGGLSGKAGFAPLPAVVARLPARSVLLLLGLWVVQDALPSAQSAARALVGLLGVLGVVSVLGIAQVAFCAEPWFVRLGVSVSTWWPALGRFFLKCHRAHAFYSI